jgi:filamentous hemagglutinin family protein
MTRCTLVLSGFLALASFSVLNLNVPALAQIIPDATLGNENSTVTPGATVRGGEADLIDGGAIRGSNLFHNFQEFNVGEGQRVYFANPDGIDSILSRITGGNPSNIFGTLGVDGTADLFFLNPNGIVFGENAVLDVEGSFYASTAEAIPLGDGVYSATEPEQSSLLTVSPSALFSSYLSDTSGDIESRGSLAAQENLTLAANRLDLQGRLTAGHDLTLLGLHEVQIRDSAEIPFIGVAGGDLVVQGNEQVDIVALNHPANGLYAAGNMTLRSANSVGGDAHYWSGGNFRVETLNGQAGELFSLVDPIIRALGDVEIENYGGSSLHILAGGSVAIGTAYIFASDPGLAGIDFLQEAVTLSDGTVVAVDGGAQPTLDVRAGVVPGEIAPFPSTNLTGVDPILDQFLDKNFLPLEPKFSDTSSSVNITVGDVWIDAPNGLVLLTNQYQPNPEIQDGTISVTGEGIWGDGIYVAWFGAQGGAIFLDSRQDIAITNSYIDTTSSGQVGDIVLLAEDSVSFKGQNDTALGAFSGVEPFGEGVGGDVRIRASRLELLDGARLSTSSFGIGNAGNVVLTIGETVRMDGINPSNDISGGVNSTIGIFGSGIAGDVRITARNLEVTNGARLNTNNAASGSAGSIILNISETARFDGAFVDDGFTIPSGVFSNSSLFEQEGTGGNVQITATNLEVTNGARLDVSSLGSGEGGSLILNIRETARFAGVDSSGNDASGAFSNLSEGTGKGGNVQINANHLEVNQGARIDVSGFGAGEAGSVILQIDETAHFDGVNPIFPLQFSGVFSSFVGGGGVGGDVQISAANLEVTNGAQIDVSLSGIGEAGDILLQIGETARFDGVNPFLSPNPSGVFSRVVPSSIGSGGDIYVTANNLELRNRAVLSSENFSFGNAGNIIITLGNQLQANNGTLATSASFGSGGQIAISAQDIFLRNDSDIQSFVRSGRGGGGNITLTADLIIALGDSDILAFSADGIGGNIFLNTPVFFGENFQLAPQLSSLEELLALDGNGRVDINATGAIASGNIAIPDVSFIENSLADLADTIIDTSTLTAGSCIARTEEDQGSFVVTGRDGLPQRPGDTGIAAYPTGTVRMVAESTANQPIQEPDGVYQLPDGRLVLSRECGNS